MMQRDFMLNEARKFALLLAKLLGLKTEGEYEEYTRYFTQVLQDEYNAELHLLLNLPEDDFKQNLLKASYSTEKLNALAQMLYVFAEPFEADVQTAAILKKMMVIFSLLETEHHYQSFENISKQKAIYNYFNNNYERV